MRDKITSPLEKIEFIAGMVDALCADGEAHIKINNPKAMADILTDAVGEILEIVDAHKSPVRIINGGAIRYPGKTNRGRII